MLPDPKITVITPTYNRPDYLPHAIASVLAQETSDWEMLIVNDGGVDVRQIVEGFGDDRLVYINRPVNCGKSACLNIALERARGDYIAYLDDDDAWYPNHLCTLSAVLDARADIGVAYSDLYSVAFLKGSDGERIPIEKRIRICRDYNRLFMFRFNHTLHVSLMHRKELAVRAGGYDENVRVLIDWDLTRKLSFYTDFEHVQQTTGEYYQPISDSDRISDVQRKDNESYLHNLRRIRADLPPEPWPHVRKVTVVLPVSRWDGATTGLVRRLLDGLDYPCRLVLVNMGPAVGESACLATLGPLGGLANVFISSAKPGASLREAYAAGASAVPAELYYLASDRLNVREELRLIKGVCYQADCGCDGVRWASDTECPEAYDLLVTREAFEQGGPGAWGDVRTVPEDWLPAELEPDCLLHFANECEKEGNYRLAQQFLDAVAAIGKGSTGSAYLAQRFAEVAFHLGNYERAERMCSDLVARGYGADNWVRLGLMRQSRGEFGPAAEAYENGLVAIGLTDEQVASDAFPIMDRADCDAFRALVGLGECLSALDRDAEAARFLRKASRLKANGFRPLVAFGRMFLKHGQLQSALEAFSAAGERQRPPRDASVEEGLAMVCELGGDPAEGYRWCLRGLARRPDCAGLFERAERLCQATGDGDELARLYGTFLEYRPGHLPAIKGLAHVYRQLGRDADARELDQRACALSSAAPTC